MPAKKKATQKSRPSKKKTVLRKASKKKVSTRKKAIPKKKVARKVAAGKKASSKKKVALARKKPTVKKTVKKATGKKKKVVAKKKTAAKKKIAVKKKTTAKKKTAAAVSRKAVKKTKNKKEMSNITKLKTGTVNKKRTTKKISPYTQRKGEEYMSPEQLAHFRDLLLEWKRDLMEEVDRTVHHMQDDAANFPDPNDRATQEEEFALELRTRDRERKLIKKIDEAITNLDNGDYGYCEVCGIEIGIRRLEARPTATLCIDCKTLDEIKERQLG